MHREHFEANKVELATMLSIKTGGCPEDCGYCPQSVHYDTGVEATKLMDVAPVAPEAYGRIITMHDYQDRLNTLGRVRNAGISVCSGGIVGMGESRRERAGQ